MFKYKLGTLTTTAFAVKISVTENLKGYFQVILIIQHFPIPAHGFTFQHQQPETRTN